MTYFSVQRNPTPIQAQLKNYTNPDNDSRGAWNSSAYTCAKTIQERPNLYYPIINPFTKEEIFPNKNRVWAFEQKTHQKNVDDNLLYWGKNGTAKKPRIKKFLTETKLVVPRSLWFHEETGHNQEAKLEITQLFKDNPFTTPKPERLIQRILNIATNPGDLVLDSFLGSGTTAAVAHKMGRRWIGIELGEHCYTHCVPRLKKVIDGDDKGGVTTATGWHGGGGFRFYELGASLIKNDVWGNPVINKEFNGEMLAQALCKLSGFTYTPHRDIYWMQGQGSERDYLYATTQFLSAAQLVALNEEVGEERSLLVYCTAFRLPEGHGDNSGEDAIPRLTVKKIPKSILDACEWDKDDYSLRIQHLPQADIATDSAAGSGDVSADVPATETQRATKQSKSKKGNTQQLSLLDMMPPSSASTDEKTEQGKQGEDDE